MTQTEKNYRIAMQVKRLRESADRLEAFSGVTPPESIAEECDFIGQVAYGVRVLAFTETQETT
jgi:hypothetical protein